MQGIVVSNANLKVLMKSYVVRYSETRIVITNKNGTKRNRKGQHGIEENTVPIIQMVGLNYRNTQVFI